MPVTRAFTFVRNVARLRTGASCHFVTPSDMKAPMTTILVLDDDQVILDLLQTVLTDAGYKAIVAPGLHAIAPETSADIVITDLVPLKAYARAQAVEWVASLRARFRGSPLFIVTAHADAVAEPDMLGANAILAKPFDVEELLAKLDELLG
jgi:DNA-binding response OmpR family regulator